MSTANSYTTTFLVEQSPAEVFAAITDVRAWWTGDIVGDAGKLGDEFTYRFSDMHRSTQKVTELVPNQRVVWRVLDAELNFVSDKSEWTGTEIAFDIVQKDGMTEVRFTHLGLVPQIECFTDCSNAWGFYINGSLRELIASGKARRTA